MKEDVLEQIMEDYLLKKGFFTKHNVKFLPQNIVCNTSNKDTVHSDIDILAYNPNTEEVKAVSCKSWQTGINLNKIVLDHKKHIEPIINNNKDEELYKKKIKEKWRGYRELMIPKWTTAFANKIKEQTKSSKFTYCLAITRVSNLSKAEEWQQTFKEYFENKLSTILNQEIPIEIITFDEIFKEYWEEVKDNKTVESTEIGRLIQLMKASELDFSR